MKIRLSILSAAIFLSGCASPADSKVLIFGDSHAFRLAHRVTDGVVVNGGVPGERASKLLVDPDDTLEAGEARLLRTLAEHAPDAVLLVQGTNDIYQGVRTSGFQAEASGSEPNHEWWQKEIERTLMAMAASCKNAGVKRVAIATIPPQRPDTPRRRNRNSVHIEGLNARLKAAAYAQGIDVLDVYGIVMADEKRLLSDDDVHLTDAGYDAVWSAFRSGLR